VYNPFALPPADPPPAAASDQTASAEAGGENLGTDAPASGEVDQDLLDQPTPTGAGTGPGAAGGGGDGRDDDNTNTVADGAASVDGPHGPMSLAASDMAAQRSDENVETIAPSAPPSSGSFGTEEPTIPNLSSWLLIRASKAVAETALAKTGVPGCFVVRWGASAGCRVLTAFSSSRRVFHFRIRETDEGVVLCDTTPKYTGPPFPSLPACLAHFQTDGIVSPSIQHLTVCARLAAAEPPTPSRRMSWGTGTPTQTPARRLSPTSHAIPNGAAAPAIDDEGQPATVLRGGPPHAASTVRKPPSTPGGGDTYPSDLSTTPRQPPAQVKSVVVVKDGKGKLGMNLGDSGGCVVVTVARPGGALAAAGVEVGWEVTSVNDAEVKDAAAAKRLVAMSNPIRFGFRVPPPGMPRGLTPASSPAVALGSPPLTPMSFEADGNGHQFKPPRLSTTSTDSGMFNPPRTITLKKTPTGKLGLIFGTCNGHVVITKVPRGSVVEEAGIKTFWELLSVEGRPCTVDNTKEISAVAASRDPIDVVLRPTTRAEIKSKRLGNQRSVSSTRLVSTSSTTSSQDEVGAGPARGSRRGEPAAAAPPSPPRTEALSPVVPEMPEDAFLPDMSLFEGVAKIRQHKGKAKWKPRHLVLDLMGSLKCYRPKGKSGKERGDKVEIDIDVRFAKEIRIGALAHADRKTKWPKHASANPGCCFSLTTTSDDLGDETWCMMFKAPEMAAAMGTSVHRFKPQVEVAALPGVISGDYDKVQSPSAFAAADDNWEAHDEEDEEEDKKLAPIPDIKITAKWGKVTQEHVGQRIEVKAPKTQDKHRIFGILRFCGPDVSTKTPLCGVELYEPLGDGSGVFGQAEYFKCEAGHALFVEQKRVRPLGKVLIRTKEEWADLMTAAEFRGEAAVTQLIEEIKLQVRAEDPFAPLVLGKLYESGRHVELNNDLATVNYQKASDYGSVDGMYCLAMQFLGQEAGGFAHQFGVRYLEKAVELNHFPSRVALAGCMFTGTGRKGRKDPERAISLLTDVAVQGIAAAQYQLGQCYIYGMGVTADHDAAVRWLKRAERQGLAMAADTLRRIESFGASTGDL